MSDNDLNPKDKRDSMRIALDRTCALEAGRARSECFRNEEEERAER